MIRRTDHGYDILDLGSTNGTWMNKKRLTPDKPYPLESGAQVRLGRLQVFVIYQEMAVNHKKQAAPGTRNHPGVSMSSSDHPAEDKLHQATEYIWSGRQDEARLLLRELVVADRNNLAAWELLFSVAHNQEEKTFCLKAILTLRPDHPWARQQLAEINPAAAGPHAGPVGGQSTPAWYGPGPDFASPRQGDP